MRLVYLIAFLLVSPLSAQITVQNTTIQNTTVSVAQASASAPDWSSYFEACYDMEGTAGEANQCGSANNDLTETGTVTEDTTNFVVGSASRGGWTAANYLSCANGTCTGITQSTGDLSVGTWVRMNSLSTDRDILDNFVSSTSGWKIQYNSATTDEFRWLFTTGTNYSTPIIPTGNIQVNTFYFLAFTHDDTTGQVAYIRTAGLNESNTSSNTTARVANSTEGFFVGAANQSGINNIDESWVYNGILSVNAVDRICACNIDGSDCTVSGGVYTDEGRWTTMCGGSVGTLPCATATSPGACT